jgi:hypothetical protein
MADLQTTTINGKLTIAGSGLISSNSNANVTDWYKLYHCDGSGTTRLHVRTPLGAEYSPLGWNPAILEVHGYHTYDGEHVHDFKAVVNVNGYNNDWYGSQIKSNAGFQSNPYVYRSNNQYGGVKRVCFAVDKMAGCQNGWLWVRWFNHSGWFNSYAWAVSSSYDNNALF